MSDLVATPSSPEDQAEAQKIEQRIHNVKAERESIANALRKAKERAKRTRAKLEQLKVDPDKVAKIVADMREAGLEPPTNYPPAKLTATIEEIEIAVREIDDRLMRLVADSLGCALEDGTIVHKYTPADIRAWCDRAVEMGAARPSFPQYQLERLIRMEFVPNLPLREAVLEKGAVSQLAEALDMRAQHVERTLGITVSYTGSGGKSYPVMTLFIPYEVACQIARILGIPPHQAGV